MKNLIIFIITGYSGSGKSTAIAAFEDAGFYCVDNMPIALLPKFLELPIENEHEIAGLAFVMDLRGKNFLSEYMSILSSLRQDGYNFEILFLEADENTLLKRYSQTRRHHPLSHCKSLIESIRAEKDYLKNIRKASDKVINTSLFNVHELKDTVFNIAKKRVRLTPLRINILSFGFKYGNPNDADLIIDVRFLSNPHFVPDLRTLDGTTDEIKKFVLNTDEAGVFLTKYLDMLDYLIPLYEKEGKAYLTVAVGCTGGVHRSVSVASAIFEHIKNQGKQVEITHRDIGQQ